eukprot:10145166-Karenia_brevis.AAC.1
MHGEGVSLDVVTFSKASQAVKQLGEDDEDKDKLLFSNIFGLFFSNPWPWQALHIKIRTKHNKLLGLPGS